MDDLLTKTFCEIKYEADSSLVPDVWCAVVSLRERASRFKLRIFSSIGLVSLVALIPVYMKLSGDLEQSGFFDYFSILSSGFSDGGSMSYYWQELSLSLLESIPIVSVIVALALIFVFLLSLRYAAKQITRPGGLNSGLGSSRLSLSF